MYLILALYIPSAYMGTLSKRNDSASVMNFMECLEDTDVRMIFEIGLYLYAIA